jgi:hypothetical protein
MGAHEVGGDAVTVAEIQELGDPRVLGAGRSADAEPRVDPLDGLRGVAVELEVVGLRPRPEGVQVRLVPDLEVPLAHLRDPVPVHPVVNQLLDEGRPGPVVAGGRDIALVAEDGLRPRRQGRRHEAELHEGTHADGQQVVDDAVRIEERVEQPILLAGERAHGVGEDAVEPHVTEPQLPTVCSQKWSSAVPGAARLDVNWTTAPS